jgi:hypothetical protein
MPLTELKSKYRKVSSMDKVIKGWQEEYDASSKQVSQILVPLVFINMALSIDAQKFFISR